MKSAITAALLAVLLTPLSGCLSGQRLLKDIAVVVTSPITIPSSAVYDSLDWSNGSESAVAVALLPFNFPLHVIKHIAYTFVYFNDIIASPGYLVADLFSDREGLKPIDLYSFEGGFPWRSKPFPELED